MSSLVLKTRGLVSAMGSRSVHLSAACNKRTMPDPVDHATGLEKYELLAKQAGNEDPFFLKSFARGVGTKENPNIVNAMDNYRMVGCVCSEDDTSIKWMWLCEGSPKRCECGYWFKLKSHPAPDKYKLPL
uniref:Mitochondrial cytochrome c oxidase subunit 5B n=1 Tax=Pseudodiaptomus poplesia TaxID=213370 RepID=A0A0U2UFU1_9MAXI|nr:mitochondrial cytochrome c oxidase subunit 5B precursor [Pseudodiaptomus poplesia]